MIIDSHIHLYPEEAGKNPRHWAQNRNENYWANCVDPTNGPRLQAWATPSQLLCDMDQAGIDLVIILGWYWENPDTCYEQNAWLRSVSASHPDRIKVAASFNARSGQKAIDDIKKCLDSGFVGIGELNPPAQGFEYTDPWLEKALQLVGEQNRFANFHVTEPAGHNYPGKIETPFSSLQSMAARHASTTFVFAHLGGLLPVFELNRTAKKDLRNVYYDTAAIPLIYSSKVYRTICDIVGAEKILFGTDYPLRTFPKKQRTPNFHTHLDSLQNANLSEEELKRILGENSNNLIQKSPKR